MAGVPSAFQLPPSVLALLNEAAYFTAVTRLEHMAAYTLLVYDWLLCFEHELQLLATPGMSPAKLVYLFCRYWPMITHPITMWVQVSTSDRSLCEKTFKVPLFLIIVNFAGAAAVLILRVYAFTGARPSVAAFLACCFAIVAAYQIWAVATQIALVPAPVPACWPVNGEGAAQVLSGYFIAPFLFDVVVTATFVWRAFNIKLQISGVTGTSAVGLFVREGAAYFIAISTINLANAIVNFLPDLNPHGVMAPVSMLLPNILACRLVINLRSAASEANIHTRGSGSRKRDTNVSFGFANSRSKGSSKAEETTLAGSGTHTRQSTTAEAKSLDHEMVPLGDRSHLPPWEESHKDDDGRRETAESPPPTRPSRLCQIGLYDP
ncbi:hypothetical protein EXIGLDRAFT_759389 [Exidia glandulosa HHB12029]|uniref:DUF6533 domain-containing protein n=1 Tax=Exidia glandulosa HHB12029 TaxID=1314781 RepID=A0A165Q4V3_EXIGL|nr:hypothetical protein EXIGLDRAFT_759389 [Exidia glandulosa HHB12029]